MQYETGSLSAVENGPTWTCTTFLDQENHDGVSVSVEDEMNVQSGKYRKVEIIHKGDVGNAFVQTQMSNVGIMQQ